MILSNYSFRLSLSGSPAVLNWRSTAALVAGIEWICLPSRENSLALVSQNVRISDENSFISIFIDKYLLSSLDCVTGNEYSMPLTSSSPLDNDNDHSGRGLRILYMVVDDHLRLLYDRKRASFVVLSYYLCPYYDHISSWPYTEKNNGNQRNTKKNGADWFIYDRFFSPHTAVLLPIRHGDIRTQVKQQNRPIYNRPCLAWGIFPM